MAKPQSSFQLFLDFLSNHVDEYDNGLHSLPEDFNLSSFPEIEKSIFTLSHRITARTGQVYSTAFLADTLHAFQLTYPEEGIPTMPMDA